MNKLYTYIFCILIVFPTDIMSQKLHYGEIRVKNIEELIIGVNEGKEGDLIKVMPGVYEFKVGQQLQPKDGMIILGEDVELVTFTSHNTYKPGLEGLPANEVDQTKVNTEPYFFKLDNVSDVKISNITLTSSELHGAIFANNCQLLEFSHLKVSDFVWSSILTYDIKGFKIHNCNFRDAGGDVRWMGAAIFSNRTINGEFFNNKIYTTPGNNDKMVGFKAFGSDYCRIHHNTVDFAYGGFSVEYMHGNNHYIEIDHNHFNGTLSIPSSGKGGDSIPGGYSFWIHHNYFSESYTLEGPRSYIIVDSNYFDFPIEKDNGRLYTDHDDHKRAEVYGHMFFINNQIKNPGRGIFWSKGGGDKFVYFLNNHVLANATLAKREGPLLHFNDGTDFSVIQIKNNIVECIGIARPLLNSEESRKSAVVENNVLINVVDINDIENPDTPLTSGISNPLNFRCGYKKEYLVEGWRLMYLGEVSE
ncbi:MAG: hypothetical protein HC819_11800 [Cyclobacteriaceae bacterium]|nr:hypothetical protein [Cyclobacteriaceae bacterium]